MSEGVPAVDWAGTRRRRWSATRLAAAVGLNLLVLWSLKLTVDRVELPRHGLDRVTRLVTVTLQPAPPPLHATPPPRPLPPASNRPHLHAAATARANAPAGAPEPAREDAPQAITQPAQPGPEAAPTVAAASAPPADLRFLDSAATRQAIRAAAHGQTLASQGDALTNTRQTPAEQLATGVDAAHKADCMKDLSGMGLLAVLVIPAAEAMGKCAHKL